MPSRCSPINDLLISGQARSNFAFLVAYRQPELQPEMCPTSGYFDTVEVWGSSPHGPTIVFNTLESRLLNPR